jgi:hypothetical protein
MCPYVDEHTQHRLDGPDRRTNGAHTAGQLTYKLQQELKRYLLDNGLSYQALAECLGSLEGAKIDLTERVVKPYEAAKLEQNGDVWPGQLLGKAKLAPHGGAPVSCISEEMRLAAAGWAD